MLAPERSSSVPKWPHVSKQKVDQRSAVGGCCHTAGGTAMASGAREREQGKGWLTFAGAWTHLLPPDSKRGHLEGKHGALVFTSSDRASPNLALVPG